MNALFFIHFYNYFSYVNFIPPAHPHPPLLILSKTKRFLGCDPFLAFPLPLILPILPSAASSRSHVPPVPPASRPSSCPERPASRRARTWREIFAWPSDATKQDGRGGGARLWLIPSALENIYSAADRKFSCNRNLRVFSAKFRRLREFLCWWMLLFFTEGLIFVCVCSWSYKSTI